MDVSKQQALDVDPRAIRQINFTANLDRDGNMTMFFIIEGACFGLFTRNCKSIVNSISSNVKCNLTFMKIKITQYKSLNVKLSNSHLNKRKSARKNETEVVLRLSSNIISDNENNFPHKSLLTNRQIANLRKAFAKYLSTDIKLSKLQLSKMIQSGGFLVRLLGPLLKPGVPL